jgi:hypothetical protein
LNGCPPVKHWLCGCETAWLRADGAGWLQIAVVLVAVNGLFKRDALERLWKFNKGEFAVAIAAIIGFGKSNCGRFVNGPWFLDPVQRRRPM